MTPWSLSERCRTPLSPSVAGLLGHDLGLLRVVLHWGGEADAVKPWTGEYSESAKVTSNIESNFFGLFLGQRRTRRGKPRFITLYTPFVIDQVNRRCRHRHNAKKKSQRSGVDNVCPSVTLEADGTSTIRHQLPV